jgi:hypothetical protein
MVTKPCSEPKKLAKKLFSVSLAVLQGASRWDPRPGLHDRSAKGSSQEALEVAPLKPTEERGTLGEPP